MSNFDYELFNDLFYVDDYLFNEIIEKYINQEYNCSVCKNIIWITSNDSYRKVKE